MTPKGNTWTGLLLLDGVLLLKMRTNSNTGAYDAASRHPLTTESHLAEFRSFAWIS